MTSTHFVTCPFCEATCGLEVELDGRDVVKVRGDDADVLSHGFICPKGASLKALHHDPDRLRAPLIRRGGEHVEATWEEAYAEIERRLPPILEEHGRDAVGLYYGNPSVHNLTTLLYGPVLGRAVATKNVFTASTVDQMPKQVSAGLMFGTMLSVPVPDVDRTDFLLMLGANPLASNGSLLTAPDMRGRLRALRERGGTFVVVDPRRTRTAEVASEHVPIVPGTDALLLFALVQEIFAAGLETPVDHLEGLDEVRALAVPFTAESVAPATGIPAETIRRLAHDLAGAPTAAVYGRMGTCTQEFGTLASWLVDVLNAITGNLDRPGGAMWTKAAAGQNTTHGTGPVGKGVRFGRRHSRVRGAREVYGEFPAACLAEEIDTPGEGQIRALITIAGNPAVSTPNAGRLDRALAGLDFMVSLDPYLNETTRHADVILPGPTPLERPHYDIGLYQFAVRNVANYTAPALPAPDGMPGEWESLLRITAIVTGQGATADIGAIDDFVALQVAQRWGVDPASTTHRGPERLLDLMLRGGPYEITLDDLIAAPHGIDLGPLEPRLPEVLRTPSGRIELAPEEIVADVPRLEAAIAREHGGSPSRPGGPIPRTLVLIGRRHLRSNNSWMHNLEPLVRGKDRCTALVHPDDAARLGLADGEPARLTTRAGEIEIPVEVSDEMLPGVISVPHGWGHDVAGVRQRVARAHAGVNVNALTDETQLDPLSGNAVLNGFPVEVAPVRQAEAVATA